MAGFAIALIGALAPGVAAQAPFTLFVLSDSASGVAQSGKPNHFLGDRFEAVAERSGLDYRWISVPPQRGFIVAEENKSEVCILGLYKTEDRAAFAKFSRAILPAKRFAIIVHQKFLAQLQSYPTFKAALSSGAFLFSRNPSLQTTPLMRQYIRDTGVRVTPHMSRGQGLKRMARGFAPQIMTQLVADFLYEAQRVTGGENLRYMFFDDLDLAPPRHLMCSKRVPDQTLNQIDDAIAALGYDLN